jgi:NMD protein affecting ribosome stability and mRNA decay
MPRYCPTCGNSSDRMQFFGNFCEECTRKKFAESLISSIEVYRCKSCGRIKAGGGFAQPGSDSLAAAVKKQLGGYAIKIIGIGEDECSAKVLVSQDTAHGTISSEKEIVISYKKVLCERCYRKACNYHEAVVQLRGDMQRAQKMLARITKYFEDRNGFITKVEENDNGMDVYLSSKKLASAFMSRMDLKPVMSYTLVGVRKGKKVYKNTYALRFG